MILQQPYLHNGISYTGIGHLYIESGPWFQVPLAILFIGVSALCPHLVVVNIGVCDSGDLQVPPLSLTGTSATLSGLLSALHVRNGVEEKIRI